MFLERKLPSAVDHLPTQSLKVTNAHRSFAGYLYGSGRADFANSWNNSKKIRRNPILLVDVLPNTNHKEDLWVYFKKKCDATFDCVGSVH